MNLPEEERWADLLTEVHDEIRRAHKIHGADCARGLAEQGDDLRWLAVLTEEVGEVARAVLDESPGWVREELVQVAAVALAVLLALPAPCDRKVSR